MPALLGLSLYNFAQTFASRFELAMSRFKVRQKARLPLGELNREAPAPSPRRRLHHFQRHPFALPGSTEADFEYADQSMGISIAPLLNVKRPDLVQPCGPTRHVRQTSSIL